jgi:hypothetical protein
LDNMKKALFLLLFLTGLAFGQGAPPITFKEIDGSPKKTAPTTIRVSNGTLSCSGSTCTITTSGGGGSAGGSDTQLQFNNAGAFGGISGATSDGTNVTFGSANLRATSPRITTSILDSAGNGMLTLTPTFAAVNGFGFANSATGNAVTFSAVGSDTNIPLIISPQGNSRLESTGALRLSGTFSDSFVTPVGSSIPTKVNVPIYDPGAFGQIFALGIGNINANRRVMSLLDGRTGNHQPTLAVFSPDENQFAGFTWNGSNTEVTILNSASGGITRFNNGTNPTIVAIIPPGNSPEGQLSVASPSSTVPAFQADSAASPTVDIGRFTINGGTSAGSYAGVSSGGYLFDVGIKRVSSQFDKTSSTTLADITGLSVSLVAGKSYRFEAILYTTSNVAGGVKFAIAGTATATNVIYEALVDDGAAISAQTRATSLGSAVGGITTVTAAYARITGTITVNAAGTLTAQFAQNASSASTSSVLVGSTFAVNEIP